eukprot:433177_1
MDYLRVPEETDVENPICEFYNTELRCYQYKPNTNKLGINMRESTRCVCNQCQIHMLIKCTSTSGSSLQDNRSILMFANIFEMIFIKINNLRFFLQSYQLFNQFLNTMMLIINQKHNLRIAKQYKCFLGQFMQYLTRRKHIAWFIKANNGKYFKTIIINSFEKYIEYGDKLMKLHFEDVHHVVPFFQHILHLMPRINSLSYYYIHKSYEKKKYKSKQIKDNYLWIQQTIINCDLEFHFCGHMVYRIYTEFKEELNDNKMCGNRLCHKKYYLHTYGMNLNELRQKKQIQTDVVKIRSWYKCKKCQMVYYCSTHCQKTDWN